MPRSRRQPAPATPKRHPQPLSAAACPTCRRQLIQVWVGVLAFRHLLIAGSGSPLGRPLRLLGLAAAQGAAVAAGLHQAQRRQAGRRG